MRLLDCRRLTGPNLLSNEQGAIIDIALDNNEDTVVDLFRSTLEQLLAKMQWHDSKIFIRHYHQGVSIAISAKVDALYAGAEALEWIYNGIAKWQVDGKSIHIDDALPIMDTFIKEESHPKSLELLAIAQQSNVVALRDDDEISLGYGKYSETWPIDSLPNNDDLSLSQYQNIPIGIVTGTNGKTTSVRLASHIMKESGLTVGTSSTDCISVDNTIIDKGDYSGPGGARTILRDKSVELAILETARGGLLRRGLGVTQANAALVTNIAEDHMGDFGVKTLEQLADVKWIVTRAIKSENRHDRIILNADDPLIVDRGERADQAKAWFSINSDNKWIESIRRNCHRSNSNSANSGNDNSGDDSSGRICDDEINTDIACTIEEGMFVLYDPQQQNKRTEIICVTDIPITISGAAKHNIMNAMGVTLFCYTLGASIEDIRRGLTSFSTKDNPGRCNVFEINGARVIVDFAHNPHGINSFLDMAANLDAKRKLLLIGQAGDRPDNDIRQLAISTTEKLDFDKIIIKEMMKYARGREKGEVANILYQQFLDSGVDDNRIEMIAEELDAVKSAISWLKPDDLIILLIHENRDKVFEYLQSLDPNV